jgi:hypothetical protein
LALVKSISVGFQNTELQLSENNLLI